MNVLEKFWGVFGYEEGQFVVITKAELAALLAGAWNEGNEIGPYLENPYE